MSDLICKNVSPYANFEPVNSSSATLPANTDIVPLKQGLSKDKFSVSNKNTGISATEINFLDNEKLVCEMPEPKVEEKKPVKPFKELKHQGKKESQEPKQSIDPEKIFNPPKFESQQPEENICIDPKNIIDRTKEHLSPELFTSTLENSKIVMDMNLEISDKNGLNNLAKDDISGKITSGSIDVNHEVFDKAIYGLKGFTSKEGNRTTAIKNVSFNNSEKAYVIDIKVSQSAFNLDVPLVWDNFQVKFKVNNNGQLVANVDKNWIFDSMIINKLEGIVKEKIKGAIPEQFKNVSVGIQKKKDQLILIPEVKDLEVPISTKASFTVKHIDGEKAKFKIDDQGHLNINLKDITLSGSSSLKPDAPVPSENSGPPDTAEINLKLGLGKDNKRQVYARGKIGIDLDEKETQGVNLGGESLGNYFNSGKILDDFSVYSIRSLEPLEKPNIQSKNYVYIQDAKMGDQKVNLATSLQLSFDEKNGITLEALEENTAPLKIDSTKNGVEFFVNGKQYFPEMQKMIKEAKDSINLETYMLHNDPSGNKVAYMLAKKAAGLDPEDDKVNISKESPQGIKVKVLFNSWQGKLEGGMESEKVFRNSINKVSDEISKSNLSPEQKELALQKLEDNLKWKFFSDGILRSDHRKVFVVDGSQATVGGMNMGSQYLSEDAYHDVMLKIAGPEVRNVQKEFLENWFEFNNLQQPGEEDWKSLLKNDEQLKKELIALQAQGKFKNVTKMATLVTDDHETNIEKGILKLIDEAKTEINIEQAFFSDSTINAHLAEAMKKGRNINVIVAKHSVVSMFDDANLYSVNELLKIKKQGAKGDIKLFYYDNSGNESKHIHTKAISVDGEKAIIGSANMIGRSLNSPFRKISNSGNSSQAMFNKELSLYVEGKTTVSEINSRLFEEDMVNNSREIKPEEIEQLVKDAGGEAALKKKALIAKFT